jgi:hypothetical protein
MERELIASIEDLGNIVAGFELCCGTAKERIVNLWPVTSCPSGISAHTDDLKPTSLSKEAFAIVHFSPQEEDAPSCFGISLCSKGFGVTTLTPTETAELRDATVLVSVHQRTARYESLQSFVSDHVPCCSLESDLAAALAALVY